MKTGNVGTTPNQYASLMQNTAKTDKADKGAGSKLSNTITNPVDTFTPSSQSNRAPKGVADAKAIEAAWRETNHHADALRKLVRTFIGSQDATGQTFWANKLQGNFQLSEADRAQAAQMVGEDGFFGVTQTTDRIMGFAKALVGEGANEEQIESMRAAVQAGFDQVAKMFGGFDNLPEVTRNTHAAIMQAFDDWVSGGQAAA